MDFSKYYAEEPEQATNETQTTEEVKDDREQLDLRQVQDFCKRFSGLNADNKSAAIVSYQCYNYRENEQTKNQDVIYQASRARVEFSYDEMQPQLAVIDLIFPTFDDQELRLMWARLQKWRREIADTPVFLIHLLERDSVTLQTSAPDNLVECNILNPILFYLTRELPTTLATDTVEHEELVGGNIIRMLVDMSFVTFEVTETDTREIKAEVLREEEEKRYLDNSVPQDV